MSEGLGLLLFGIFCVALILIIALVGIWAVRRTKLPDPESDEGA